MRSFVTSSGSLTNCAGGAMPWGSWITCEEDRTTDHGYCFEVDPADPETSSRARRSAIWASSRGAIWFDDTAGGEERLRQIFRYLPRSNRLELFLENSTPAQMESPDNMTITPWGDAWFVEDGAGSQRVMGVTPGGDTYVFAENRLVGAEEGDATELAGPTFAPDGKTFSVNLYDPGHTLAITGPFRSRRDDGGRRLAWVAPRHGHAPGVTDELAEYAARNGRTPWEAAAFGALGATVT